MRLKMLAWVALSFVLSGCGTPQIFAAKVDLVFAAPAPEHRVPPGCIALLATSPAGDRLVQSISLQSASKGCLGASRFPPAASRIDGEWVVSYDAAAQTTARYKVVEQTSPCVFLVEVRQNFGGSATLAELLVLQTGALREQPVVTVLDRHGVGTAQRAREEARTIAATTFCGLR